MPVLYNATSCHDCSTPMTTCYFIKYLDKKLLADIARNYLDLLQTSLVLYEASGECVQSFFSSKWCQLLNSASIESSSNPRDDGPSVFDTDPCHSSCWARAAKPSIHSGEPVEASCRGGLQLYAVPIKAKGTIRGAICFGYGAPPREPELIEAIAAQHHVDPTHLHALSAVYTPRSPEIIEAAKANLRASAMLMGEILERRMVEEELRASKEKYRAVFRTNPILTLIVSLDDGHCLEVNEALLQMTGFSREELIGNRIQDLGIWVDPSASDALHRQLKTQGHFEMKEIQIRSKSSEHKTLLFSAETRELHGRPCIIAAGQDITERNERERLLRESEERYALVLNGTNDGIWDWDLRTMQVYFSPRWKEIIGYGDAEICNDLDEWKSRIHPEDFDNVMATHERFFRAEDPVFEIEYRLRHKDGSYRWILGRGACLRDQSGKPYRMAGSHTDMTRRKQIEAELSKAKEDAERASKAKSEFLANMSHEIRTPLSGMLGMTELAMMNELTPGVREHLQMAMDSGKSLLAIINDVLDLSKIEAGRSNLEQKKFSLRELADSTIKSLAVSAKAKGLRIFHAVDTETPDYLLGDPGRLRQVLTNLIGNALKFTEHGTVTVSMMADAVDAPAGKIILKTVVKDTGIGIPESMIEDIFKSFNQGVTSAHATYGGTGLGLTISKELVEKMGGRIWVESRMGQGSAFHYTVELALADEELDTAEESVPSAPTRTTGGFRILLVEDNRINSLFAAYLLEKLGHSVRAVASGVQALAALREEKFDLVLMDVRMPEMDGAEATRRIRAGEAGDPKIPIVALTAYALQGDRERFLAVGMDDYVSKPMDTAELERVLERVGRRE
ncbi:PAS domain S-box [Desulfocurvibacter africanus PCS]|uniref:Sensory/regulatory protein RpfC n=2 Tax=Desulfocurvibacter africanus TaxID=873 RepID=M5PQX0_DESAF|nr:PAS domain S-box [Desulfocurvibacter africanus PCS]